MNTPLQRAAWNKSIRDSVDDLLCDLRHQLSMMNFDEQAQAVDPTAIFNAVINFAVQQGIDASVFLSAWREGDTSEWPEFTPPAKAQQVAGPDDDENSVEYWKSYAEAGVDSFNAMMIELTSLRAHLDDGIVHNLYLHPAPLSTGERAEVIKELRLLKFHVGGSIGDIVKRAADMLEADADLRTQLARRTVERDMAISMAAGVDAQQVAVPALKIKPFTQRLRDNREADYSLDALMPPTRKEIESAMHEEIVELRNTLKAQQVAVPDGYTLVPIKPTPEMIAAAEGVEDLYRRGTPDTWGKVYRAMINEA